MHDNTINDLVRSKLSETLDYARNRRQCEKYGDLDFLYHGVSRVIGAHRSGRSFVQEIIEDDHQESIARATYFNGLHSKRRNRLVKECEPQLRRRLEIEMSGNGIDHLSKFKELDGYDIHSYDGHYHTHACHAPKDDKGRYRSVGGIFGMNLRNGLVQHLATTDFDVNKTNEIRAFRDIFTPKTLEGNRKKTIAVVDKAYNDSSYWDLCRKMKHNGMYVITLLKENAKIHSEEALEFDADHSYNCGIISDSKIRLSTKGDFRKIVYKDPETDTVRTFLTTVFDVAPGIIAYLYLWRWKIEKVFNTFKSGLGEVKAWANGKTSVDIQASMMAMTFNIMLATQEISLAEEGIVEKKLQKKWEAAIKRRKEKAKALGRFLNPLVEIPHKFRQLSLQFIRCFRLNFGKRATWRESIPKFQVAMEGYL